MIRLILPACSVCFGDPNSLMTKGTIAGVLFLMGVIVLVLGAIFMTAVSWVRNAKRQGQGSF